MNTATEPLSSNMVYTYKIATLNINAIRAPTPIKMLQHFVHVNDIDLLCVQEVNTNNIQMIRNYTTQNNIGTEGRGTAFIYKDIYTLTDVRIMSSGRGIMATFNGIRIVNIYAHSGTSRKAERETFFNVEVPRFMYVQRTQCCLLEISTVYSTPVTARERRQ
jgi:exonuclease III